MRLRNGIRITAACVSALAALGACSNDDAAQSSRHDQTYDCDTGDWLAQDACKPQQVAPWVAPECDPGPTCADWIPPDQQPTDTPCPGTYYSFATMKWISYTNEPNACWVDDQPECVPPVQRVCRCNQATSFDQDGNVLCTTVSEANQTAACGAVYPIPPGGCYSGADGPYCTDEFSEVVKAQTEVRVSSMELSARQHEVANIQSEIAYFAMLTCPEIAPDAMDDVSKTQNELENDLLTTKIEVSQQQCDLQDKIAKLGTAEQTYEACTLKTCSAQLDVGGCATGQVSTAAGCVDDQRSAASSGWAWDACSQTCNPSANECNGNADCNVGESCVLDSTQGHTVCQETDWSRACEQQNAPYDQQGGDDAGDDAGTSAPSAWRRPRLH